MGRSAKQRSKRRAAQTTEKGFIEPHLTSHSISSQPCQSRKDPHTLQEEDDDVIIVGYDPPPPPPRPPLLPTPVSFLSRAAHQVWQPGCGESVWSGDCPPAGGVMWFGTATPQSSNNTSSDQQRDCTGSSPPNHFPRAPVVHQQTKSPRRTVTNTTQGLHITVAPKGSCDPAPRSHDHRQSKSSITSTNGVSAADKIGILSVDCEMVGCVEVQIQHSDAHFKLRACDFVKQHNWGVRKKRRKGKFEKQTGVRQISVAARCSIVDYNGTTIYDSYINPEPLKIVDLRTRYSGITTSHLKTAKSFQTAQREIKEILLNCKTLVGHHIENDILALAITVPANVTIRDTSSCVVLRRMAGLDEGKIPSLKKLAWSLLGVQIQRREHCSVEDAWATMQVYKLVEKQWSAHVT